MNRMQFLSSLAQAPAKGHGKIVLWVLDGVGDLRTTEQPHTALELARTPHLDALTQRSALGRMVPVIQGVTPGSGPGHLGLFGYDVTRPEIDIGRGVLEALGSGISIGPKDVVARGNFVTLDKDGKISDRRAGRIASVLSHALVEKLNQALEEQPADGAQVELFAGEAHRFVLRMRAVGSEPEPGTEQGTPRFGAGVEDTDPQRAGVPVLDLAATRPDDEAAQRTIAALESRMPLLLSVLAAETQANSFSLRGFSSLPHLPSMEDLYRLRAGCFAGYPLYRGVASACGMTVLPCGKKATEVIDAVAASWQEFDLFFLHTKGTDQAGEDGDLEAKVAVIEEVDAALPKLLELGPEVIAITGDHSTPVPMRAHSWHPIPLLLHGPRCFVDDTDAFDELQTIRGHIGQIQSQELLGLLLGNAGRLAKFGA